MDDIKFAELGLRHITHSENYVSCVISSYTTRENRKLVMSGFEARAGPGEHQSLH